MKLDLDELDGQEQWDKLRDYIKSTTNALAESRALLERAQVYLESSEQEYAGGYRLRIEITEWLEKNP